MENNQEEPNSEKNLAGSTEEVGGLTHYTEPRESKTQGAKYIKKCGNCANGTIELGRCSSCDAPELPEKRYSTAKAGAKAG